MAKLCSPSDGFIRDDATQESERTLFRNLLQSPAADAELAIEQHCKELTGRISNGPRPVTSAATIGGVHVRRARRTSTVSTHSMKAFQLMSGVLEEDDEEEFAVTRTGTSTTR